MVRVYLAAVDIVPAAVIIIPLFLVLHYRAYGRDTGKSALYCLFCLYLSAVFALVGIPNVTYFRQNLTLNLIPFLGIVADLKNSILNIVLFVPLGCFLPVLWQRFRELRPTVFFGFALSLGIELLQTLTYRATDVNDLITNTLGAAVGFLLIGPIVKKHPPVGSGQRDVYLLCGLSFAVMFFLHPFLSPLIWDRIL